ncbi:hypothetical protein A2210_00390 [Candidatus Woesebacteria bacterium RIFOXYA1_FULL_40_18]|uniref:PF07610 family protein n=4 Tax=Candidatus Woeseibacteriota TaxID=1752722 RepID=A0A0G0SKK2_9BACT|nr:MAG: hypothetical protein UU03_C0020G0009 [Candidatus Woesebacteria bacterium GW2011_GWA1_40_45]OGM75541.1 MAG: hypothetical protein A2210_00390 [Candidatus Woesebacteria bacterium RIFOXYA1_FULL_40_18]OGM79880.1 MAG: hypothetical protein A2361_02200 [Candidatus Woesebacteria bacterium RIFOXYB1_FULL_40_26]OGM87132.1 MAG: hypothetical protein A2614_02300 [Candidatus Woesebacteria bacterium RIFOXYD1_FULL_40_21]
MNNETKFIIGSAVVTLGLIVGLTFFISAKGAKERTLVTTEVLGVSANPANYDLGDVPIKGGIITKEYEIKNATDADMELIKIVTSCMCTTASVKAESGETRFFAMEMGGDKNPFISLKVKKGETVKVTVKFDPAAHGPAGVGPIDRVVSLYFDTGVKELTFKGVVVK